MPISLPHEVFSFHILPRLPIKSVIRFKCVSKQWHSSVSSDMFKKMYNHCHIDEYQNQDKLLVLSETIPCKFSTIDCEAPENGLTPSRPLPFEGSPGDIKILASSHGLVCVGIISNINRSEYSHLILWNPLTNEYKTLPKSDSRVECYNRLSRVFGLYYSSCEDDYKLLCVTYHIVYMYSLKSESWRKLDSIIANPNLYLGIEWWSPGTCLNDNLYFLCDSYSIIRFDTKSEQFTRIATPTFDEDGLYNWCSTMMVLRGCIHFCVRYEIAKTGFTKICIRLWKMNGDGKWKKVVIYQPVSNIVGSLKPLYLMRNGNLLLIGSSGNLYTENQGVHSRVCQKNKKLNSKGLRYEVRYIETFVSPNQHSK
ncbi:putative F-box domain-containing protein [Tanacetum coccineum]